MPIKRAISVHEILNTNFVEMPFIGKWESSFGSPERSGVWIIWGNSGNGKTSFAMQLARYLTQFGKVAYNSLEEGARKSLKLTLQRNNMQQVSKHFFILSEDIEELRKRLAKRKSPNIVIIDSFQYTGMTKAEYKKLKKDFPTKLFIFISHAEGKNPEGRAAKFVMYDADIKIRVEGYKAFFASRFGGGDPLTIWEKGASEYWAEIN